MISLGLSGAESPAVAPAPELPFVPGKQRTLSADDKALWDKRAERANTFRERFEPQWDRALSRYAKALYDKECHDVNALLDFSHVETKKAHLFHRTPEVQLTPVDPKDPAVPFAQLLPLRQKYLNFKLGPKASRAKRAFHKSLVDALAASGWMVLEVGYEQRALPVPGETNPDGSPVEVPIWSRCFLSRVSPKKALVPSDFHDTDFDEAPWLAIKGSLALSQARGLKWKLPADFEGSASVDKSRFTHDLPDEDPSDPQVEFTKVWYRAAYFDPLVFNPELFRCLILVKGVEEPVWHVDSPYQAITPEGALTDDSMVGNPICIGTLRDLPDSAYVPSDLTVGEQLSREVNKFRTQQIRGRTKRQPIVLVAESLGQPVIDKLTANEGPVPVPDAYIDAGGAQRALAVAQTGTEPRDNFTAQDYAERDWQKALGTSDVRTGQQSKKKTTATEIRNVAGNAAARDETEKDNAREFFISVVRKFDSVIQRYATPQDVAKVLGQQGAALWEQWKALPGKYGYEILPDAGQYVDVREHQDRVVDLYNLTRKDERVNAEELLTMLALAHMRDPAKFINPPQDKTTEPPSASLNFKGEDTLNPAMGNLLLDLLANGGIKLRPETIAAFAEQHAKQKLMEAITGQPIGADGDKQGHGGSADKTEPVNQHQTERTGGMQGVGVQ